MRKLTFTGSTGVGKALVKQSSDKLLRTSMWSSAATPRSWSSTTPTSTPRWRVRCWPRCATRGGLHRGQPLPRGQLGARGVHRQAGQADERVNAGQRPGRVLDAGPADLGQAAAHRGRSGLRRRRARRPVAVGGAAPGGPGHFYPATVLADVRPTRASSRRRSSGPSPRSPGSTPRRRASPRPTTPTTGGVLHLHEVTRPGAAGGGVHRIRHGRGEPRGHLGSGRPVRRGQGVGFGARAAPRASRSTWRPSTSPSRRNGFGAVTLGHRTFPRRNRWGAAFSSAAHREDGGQASRGSHGSIRRGSPSVAR